MSNTELKRQTGRTSRMLEEVARIVTETRTARVVVVGRDNNHGLRMLQEMFSRILTEKYGLDHRAGRIERMDRVRWMSVTHPHMTYMDWKRMEMTDIYAGMPVFVDHEVIQTRIGNRMLEEMMRWDLPEEGSQAYRMGVESGLFAVHESVDLPMTRDGEIRSTKPFVHDREPSIGDERVDVVVGMVRR